MVVVVAVVVVTVVVVVGAAAAVIIGYHGDADCVFCFLLKAMTHSFVN